MSEKNLVLVESPSKAKTIEKYLGKDYKVLATVGHVIDLPKSTLGVDLEKDYSPQFTVIKGKKAVITQLKKAIPKGGNVLLAMDPDREGEAIAWHISQALGLKNADRIVFFEITKDAVNEAISHPRKIDDDLVQAQIARRVLDRLVGYKLSELLWKKIWYGLSAGRVQSAALRLIVEREREIESFIPEEYWDVLANSIVGKSKFDPKLIKIDEKKAKIVSSDEFEGIKKDLKDGELIVSEVKNKLVNKRPFPPFTTSKLQQAANNAFGFTAKRTMALAQALYQEGYITYMRTDSYNLSAKAIDAARETIVRKYGEEYLPADKRYYKNRSKNAQEAHEAIRPTDFTISKTTIQGKLGDPYAKLYGMIYDRTLSSQMADRRSEVLSIKLDSKGKSGKMYQFNIGAEKVLFEGFRAAWGSSEGLENEQLPVIEKIHEGEIFPILDVTGKQNFTNPKPRYTDATLVKALEKYGIGRPSTYATIISTVQDRGYVVKDGKSLVPLDIGRVVVSFLEKNFERLVDYEYTAGVENGLDEISEGKREYVKFIDNEFKPLMEKIGKAEVDVNKDDVVIIGTSEEKCDKCGSDMVVRVGRYGKFLSCSKFPECKGMKSLAGGEETLDMEKYYRPEKCPICGKEVMLKSGRYGQFWACVDYPECKGTYPLLLNEKCPECGKQLVERKSRWGQTFSGCSGYPDCKYIKKENKEGKSTYRRRSTKKGASKGKRTTKKKKSTK